MNRRQKKKKNKKYEYTWGHTYKETKFYDRRTHEKRIILRRKGLI